MCVHLTISGLTLEGFTFSEKKSFSAWVISEHLVYLTLQTTINLA